MQQKRLLCVHFWSHGRPRRRIPQRPTRHIPYFTRRHIPEHPRRQIPRHPRRHVPHRSKVEADPHFCGITAEHKQTGNSTHAQTDTHTRMHARTGAHTWVLAMRRMPSTFPLCHSCSTWLPCSGPLMIVVPAGGCKQGLTQCVHAQ